MKLTLALILFMSHSLAIELKPGSWEQTVQINAAALMMSPEVKAQMSLLPKEQATMMLNMMASQMPPKVMKECVTGQMIKNPTSFIPNQKECTTKILNNTKNSFSAQLNCKQEIDGVVTINAVSPSEYKGNFSGKSKEGTKMDIQFAGKLVSDTCQK